MTEAQMKGWYDPGLEVPGASSWVESKHSVRGEQRIIDFMSQMLQEGRCYQIRAGTIATGIAMENVMNDTVASMCYDAGSGLTIIPIQFGMAAREIATALTVQVALKGVGAVSSAGTAFIPLPLLQGGSAASGSARVASDAVTVAAELATTTVRIFEYENVMTHTALGNPTVGLQQLTVAASSSQLQYVGKGAACIYMQAAAATAFPLYFAHLNVMELLTTAIG